MFALRVSFSMTLVCMVNQTALNLIKAQQNAKHFVQYSENGNTTDMSVIISMHNQSFEVSGNRSAAPIEDYCDVPASASHHTHHVVRTKYIYKANLLSKTSRIFRKLLKTSRNAGMNFDRGDMQGVLKTNQVLRHNGNDNILYFFNEDGESSRWLI